VSGTRARPAQVLSGWVEKDGEWQWKEDDPTYTPSKTATFTLAETTATPKLPSGSYKPKQSLGQNYLRDGNTVNKILRAFHADAIRDRPAVGNVVELGPGAGALTDKLVETYGTDILQCIEIDERSVGLLLEKHPELRITHADVLQVNYPELAEQEGQPLVVVGNLPYYITSQILFALADASHSGAVVCATVTMQWEVAQRMVAMTSTKDYGILSVVFQLYADTNLHFKIPPTVFYPKPKVDSALVGLHFLGPAQLRKRLAGVNPADLRRVVTLSFQQRRKTVRNSLKKLAKDICLGDADQARALLDAAPLPLPWNVRQAIDEGDAFAAKQELPANWASKRPEELTPGQFVELTRLFYGPNTGNAEEPANLGNKVWRKLKHGSS
jgi:ribosomal RNA small subunit methyltransferase A